MTKYICFVIFTHLILMNSILSKSDRELEAFQGYEGVWLKTDRIEVFVGLKPNLRIVSLSIPDQANILNSSPETPVGIRTWLMNPVEKLDARGVFDTLPADTWECIPNGIVARTQASPDLGLSLQWTVVLDPDKPELTIDHEIRNRSDQQQDISVWSLIVLRPSSVMEIPLDHPERIERLENPYPLYLFPYASHRDPRMEIKDDVLHLSVTNAPEFGGFKIGVVSSSGSGVVRLEDQELVSRVPYIAGAIYPEGGPNITAYLTGNVKHLFGELEHMSPIESLHPGAKVSLKQRLSLEQAKDSRTMSSVND